MVADGLGNADYREPGPAEAAALPLLLRRRPVRGKPALAAVDAQRSLAPVLGGELGILRQAQDVGVRVDQRQGHRPSIRSQVPNPAHRRQLQDLGSIDGDRPRPDQINKAAGVLIERSPLVSVW